MNVCTYYLITLFVPVTQEAESCVLNWIQLIISDERLESTLQFGGGKFVNIIQ